MRSTDLGFAWADLGLVGRSARGKEWWRRRLVEGAGQTGGWETSSCMLFVFLSENQSSFVLTTDYRVQPKQKLKSTVEV